MKMTDVSFKWNISIFHLIRIIKIVFKTFSEGTAQQHCTEYLQLRGKQMFLGYIWLTSVYSMKKETEIGRYCIEYTVELFVWWIWWISCGQSLYISPVCLYVKKITTTRDHTHVVVTCCCLGQSKMVSKCQLCLKEPFADWITHTTQGVLKDNVRNV